MLFVDELVRRGSLRGQALIQPASCRRHRGILIPQPHHQLDGKGRRQGRTRIEVSQRVRLRRMPVQAQQPVGHGVRVLARRTAADDARSGAPQILDQYDAQRDGHRPKLTDGQRLNTLVGTDE